MCDLSSAPSQPVICPCLRQAACLTAQVLIKDQSLLYGAKIGGREAFESFDGQFVFYYIANARSGIRRVPVADGEEVRVIEQAAQGNWALSARGIYFLAPTTNRSTQVQFFNFGNGRSQTVLEIARVDRQRPRLRGLSR